METKTEPKKKYKFGRLRRSLTAILLVAILASIITVSAVAYVVMTWTISATVVSNPKSCFFLESNGTTKANNFTYSVNIFPSITTIDTNITYGVWDWGNSGAVSMCWASCSSSTNIASLGIKVYNSSTTIYQQSWPSIPSFPTPYVTFSPAMMNNGKYAIAMNITATSSASGSSAFAFSLKVVSP
jgi:hypothetical protein